MFKTFLCFFISVFLSSLSWHSSFSPTWALFAVVTKNLKLSWLTNWIHYGLHGSSIKLHHLQLWKWQPCCADCFFFPHQKLFQFDLSTYLQCSVSGNISVWLTHESELGHDGLWSWLYPTVMSWCINSWTPTQFLRAPPACAWMDTNVMMWLW